MRITTKPVVALLLAAALGCAGASSASHAADDFEVHLIRPDGLASVAGLHRDLGAGGARAVLHELADRGQFVAMDGDRVCVKGALRYGRGGAFTGETLSLHDLSLPGGWDNSVAWTPGDFFAVIDSMHFEPGALVFTWHGEDRVSRTVAIPWTPGVQPAPGRIG
jgi:hypothetical protein